MAVRQSLSDLGIYSANDLCVLDDNPPPMSFTCDLDLPPRPIGAKATTPKRSLDTTTYWQPQGFHP